MGQVGRRKDRRIKMRFSDLKDAVPFKTVLVDGHGAERYFIAINPCNNRLITSRLDDSRPSYWSEAEIENWTIKQPKKTLLAFRNNLGGVILEEEGSNRADYSINHPEEYIPVQILIDGKPVQLEIREK